MELYDRALRSGYVYDPVVKQYDSGFWKTTAGTPAMSTNVLRFTSAAAASYIQHVFADVEFLLNAPVAPTTSQDKIWGLRNPASDNLGAAYFQITGGTFQVVTVDEFGVSETTAVTWNEDWDGAAVKYRIIWDNGSVIFHVDGAVIAVHSTRVPKTALALRIVNGNADNMDLSYIGVRAAAQVI